MQHIPKLLLGTAQFGWTTARKTAFELLDAFYESGFRQIDSATNYPINKNSNDFRAAETILQDWIRAHGVKDIRLMMKVGSLNNLHTSDCNLNPSFLLMSLENYRNKFRENLDTIMIHWDNRADILQISQTFDALNTIKKEGIDVGLSGIKYPEQYAEVNKKYNLDFYIQIKNNVLNSDFEHYNSFFTSKKYIAYGINAGGLKLNTSEYTSGSTLATRGGDISNQNEIFVTLQKKIAQANENTNRPSINSFFQLGMIFSYYNPAIYALLIGNSSVEQWKSTLDFYQNLNNFDYNDVFND
jgi:aryl-alcohol dehydrogenase-like predicted oxidoreductase